MVGKLFVRFNTLVKFSSVKDIPSVLEKTFIEPLRSPVLLFTDAQSKLSVPAFKPVKSIKKSRAAAVLLSADPVDNSTIDCEAGTWSVPFCTPPDEPKVAPWNVLVCAVIFIPSGMVPVALADIPLK